MDVTISSTSFTITFRDGAGALLADFIKENIKNVQIITRDGVDGVLVSAENSNGTFQRFQDPADVVEPAGIVTPADLRLVILQMRNEIIYAGLMAEQEAILQNPRRVDEVNSALTYLGYSLPGAAENSPEWIIKRIFKDGTLTTISWAIAYKSKTAVWADRAGYDYTIN